jgi:hypothetical protein
MSRSGGSLQRTFRDATLAAAGGQTTHGDPVSGNMAQSTYSYPRAGLASTTPEEDQRLRTKMQMMKKDSGMTPFGQVMATDADFKLLDQKQKIAELANFDKWVGENFHKGDVVARQWLQEVHPGYYDAREKEIDDRAEFAKMVAKVKLRGPATYEELVLVYGLMEGKIQLEPGWNIIGYRDADTLPKDKRQERFASHLMGPFRHMSKEEREANAKVSSNPFGGPDAKVQKDLFGADSNLAMDDFINMMANWKV